MNEYSFLAVIKRPGLVEVDCTINKLVEISVMQGFSFCSLEPQMYLSGSTQRPQRNWLELSWTCRVSWWDGLALSGSLGRKWLLPEQGREED